MTEPIIIKNKRQGINSYFTQGKQTILKIFSKKYGEIEFIIDTDFVHTAMQYPWNVRYYRKYFYAYSYLNNKGIALHRLITNCPKDKMVDHINHNTLDNRRENLKTCTNKENQHNRKGTEGIKKTNWGYQVTMRVGEKTRCFGTYKTFEEAKIIRMNAEKKYRPYALEVKYGNQ